MNKYDINGIPLEVGNIVKCIRNSKSRNSFAVGSVYVICKNRPDSTYLRVKPLYSKYWPDGIRVKSGRAVGQTKFEIL